MTKFRLVIYPIMGVCLLLGLLPGYSRAITIDHTCTDMTRIPDYWIDQVKQMLKVHYAHTSHGEQITVGLERLSAADSKYNFYPDNCTVPDTTSHLSLMDGQYYDGDCATYITPDLYWQGTSAMNITRSVLTSFDVNISLWAWCTQLDYYSQSQVQTYLNNMARLESEFPEVTFVYMTGNAQSEGEQNRYDRNQQIREYCRNNNKVLFDFADLDCWYGNEQHTASGIPSEHPQYEGDEAGHTTYESCENKARAFWWLLARIAGWNGGTALAPDIRANGSHGPITVSSGSPVSITVSLDPGASAGQNADWWVAAATPFAPPGDWYSYVYPTGWGPGRNRCIQTGLFGFASFEVMNRVLLKGAYTFYFAIDDPDGLATGPWWGIDSVGVTVE
ncbi:MAG: hypothetical protein K9M96_09570 [Deltaproteobacteria bacterium]|nr:hypothetical protein [Deltaproteobacteria bacterium]